METLTSLVFHNCMHILPMSSAVTRARFTKRKHLGRLRSLESLSIMGATGHFSTIFIGHFSQEPLRWHLKDKQNLFQQKFHESEAKLTLSNALGFAFIQPMFIQKQELIKRVIYSLRVGEGHPQMLLHAQSRINTKGSAI